MRTIQFEGDTYRILSTGRYADGMILCHLASETRGQQQRNGWRPIQITAEVCATEVERALDRPRGFYSWNRSMRGAFERGERDAEAGKGLDACPYPDSRKADGRLTWSRAYRTAWTEGHQHHTARASRA